MNRVETQVVVYTSAAHGMVHIFELAYPAVMVFIMAEFAQGKFAMGIVANIFAFGWGVAAIPAGFMSDRIGSRRVILMTLLGAAAGAAAVSLSPNIHTLGFTMAILGLATGLYHPSGLSLIAVALKAPQLAFAYHGMVGNLGVALAPFLAVGIASLWNWRASFLVLGAMALIIALLVNFSSLPRHGLAKASPSPSGGGSRPRISGQSAISLALILIAFMLLGFIYRGSITFLPLYLTERVQLTLFNLEPAALAGSFASLALLFGILGQYLGGLLSRRFKLEPLMVVHALVITPPLILMGMFGGGLLVVLATLFAFLYFVAQPIYSMLIARYAPAEFQGRAFGIAFFFSFGLGSFAASFGGYIAQNLGTAWVFLSMGSLGILLLLVGLALTQRSRAAGGADILESERR